RADHIRARGKLAHQRIGRIVGGLGRRRVDDGENAIDPLRESGVDHFLLLAPGQRTRHEFFAVGADGDMACEIAGADGSQKQEGKSHGPRMANGELDQPRYRGRRRKVTTLLHDLRSIALSSDTARFEPRSAHERQSAHHYDGAMRIYAVFLLESTL